MRFGEAQWLWLMLLIPAAAAFFLFMRRRRDADLARFVRPALWSRMLPGRDPGAEWWKLGLLLTGLFFLCLMAARPQLGSRILAVKRQGVDVMVALDVSESMMAEDLKPNRITRARQEIQTLIDRLRGDRVGLVAFSGEAFTQCPLTLDYSAARMFLRYLTTDLIPVPGTAIAQAIEVAVDAFDQTEKKFKALVLITDGEDHEGRLEEAARKAKDAGVRIYAVGIGTAKGEPIPVRDARGNLVDYKRDSRGEVVMTSCDAAALQEICTLTGGRYFDGNTGQLALDRLYEEISGMEQKEMKGGIVTQYEDRYGYFAGAALLLLALEWMLGTRRRSKARAAAGRAVAMLAILWVGAARADDGGSAYSQGKYEAARDAYEKLAAERPTDPRVQYNLGTALHQTGEMEPAMRALQQALASPDPKLRARAWYNLGDSQAKAGDLESARDSFRMALRQDSSDRDTKVNLELVDRLLKEAKSDSSSQQQKSGGKQDQQKKDEKQKNDQKQQNDSSKQDQQDQSKKDDEQQKKQDEQNQQNPAQKDQEQKDQAQQQGKEDASKKDGQDKPQPQSADQAEGTPQDSTMNATGRPLKISPEEARRLLEALQQQEMLLQAERLKSKIQPRHVEKDW